MTCVTIPLVFPLHELDPRISNRHAAKYSPASTPTPPNASPTNSPRQNHSKLCRLDRIELPVIEIIVQRAVSASELQILEDLSIAHHLQRIEHIAALLLRRNDHILHQLLHAHRRVRVVIAVRRRERVVLPIPDHRRLDVEEREEIRHLSALLVHAHVAPHHILAGEEEMRRFRFRELLVHREPTEKASISGVLLEVRGEKLHNRGDVRVGEGADARNGEGLDGSETAGIPWEP